MNTLREILLEHYEYRKQLIKLAKSNILKTYRGAALGWSWALIKPSTQIFVFWFAFSFGLRSGGDISGYPFFLWLIAGMTPWFYISEMISQGTDSIRKYSYLVTKLKFPISIIPTFVSISKLVINMAITGIVIVIFALFGHWPDIYYLQLPFYILCMFIFCSVWGLLGGILSSMSRDFSNLVKSLVNMLFWLSGIIYDARGIDNEFIKTILLFNPVTFLANGYRNVFIEKVWFWENVEILYFIMVLAVFVVLTVWAYKKLRKDIPDVL
ncbi:MAG: ABC transporter permease [Firmicutes bacterium]|nr:ABC transporter permease [Bacillota bacterium]